MKINRKTLSNGLRIVHHQDTGTQMVAVNTIYKVGARNEDPEHTGFAHLFEHLMFGGSINIPDFETPLQEASAENNAFTDADYTNYYITIPAQNIETALWLESDRMLSLAFTTQSLEVQRKVVMEEFKQTHLNQPYGDLAHILFALAYRQHPYRWPVIGLELSHIAEATMEQVKAFFAKWYRPDNAIITIDGNISWERTQELIEKWYGDIPSDPHTKPIVNITPEPTQIRQRRKTVRRNVPNSLIVIAFHIPTMTSPEFRACDMLSDVLANGKSSRFYKKLVEEQKLFIQLNASVMGRIDDGLFLIEGLLDDKTDIDSAENAIWQEINILHKELVDEYEIEKLKNKFEANHNLQTANYLQRAQMLAYFEMLGDARLIDSEVENYCQLTPQDLKDAARKFLTKKNSSVLRYLAN